MSNAPTSTAIATALQLTSRKDSCTQTLDPLFLGIFTHQGEDADVFYRYIKGDSPDILPVFIKSNTKLARSIAYAPHRYIVERLDRSAILPDTIVDCFGGTIEAYQFWSERNKKIRQLFGAGVGSGTHATPSTHI
jgi:hypothetical protein